MGRAPTFPRAGPAHSELGAATGGAHMTPPGAGLGASVVVIAFLLPVRFSLGSAIRLRTRNEGVYPTLVGAGSDPTFVGIASYRGRPC